MTAEAHDALLNLSANRRVRCVRQTNPQRSAVRPAFYHALVSVSKVEIVEIDAHWAGVDSISKQGVAMTLSGAALAVSHARESVPSLVSRDVLTTRSGQDSP